MSAQRRWLRALTSGWMPLLVGIVVVGVLAPASAAHADPTVQQIQKQITAQSAALEKIVEQYNKINEDLKATQLAADKIQSDLKPLNDQLDSASKSIGELAASAYKGAPLAGFSSVFEAGDPSTMVDRMTTLDQITKYTDQQIQSFTETKAKADVEKTKLDRVLADQQAQKAGLESQKTKINADIVRLEALRKKVYGSQPRATTTVASTPPNVSGKAGVAVNFAYAQLGKPYSWGADGPGSYDCSGLTAAAWRAAGVSLPHNAAMQYRALPHLSRGALQPGDLVFYAALDHVAIYVGNNQIIQAPTYGERVKVSSVDMMKPYGYARPG